jgi:serine/threonine protein kinase
MAEQQRYRVLKRLAQGGMAEVFVAESAGIEGFKKQVAIKRVLPTLSEKKQFIAMFLDEARLSAQLSHSNVVSVFDIGVGDNTYFIVMEYVDGADLKQILEYQRGLPFHMPVEVAAFIATKICQGLSYAHELSAPDGRPLNIVHRDITPANILITRHGEVKIVDFGLAKASSQLADSDAGVIKGKFGYLAPETVQGQPVDHRVDVFSVGIILWEMLAGRRLFLGETDYDTVMQVQAAEVPPLADINPAVPPDLEAVVRGGLARDPEERYQTARDFGRDLTRFLYLHGNPVSEFDVADLVRAATESAPRVATRAGEASERISDLIDMMLLEFKSLPEGTEEAQAGEAGGDIPDDPGDADFVGGLADELEGPDPGSAEENAPLTGVAGWFSSLTRR